MFDLTGFQRDALYVVAGSDGKVETDDINDKIERLYGREVKAGTLYSNMRQLHEKGLVERHRLTGRKYGYTITRRGELELAEKREWEDSFPNI